MLKNEKKKNIFFFFYINMMYIKIDLFKKISSSCVQFIININCWHTFFNGACQSFIIIRIWICSLEAGQQAKSLDWVWWAPYLTDNSWDPRNTAYKFSNLNSTSWRGARHVSSHSTMDIWYESSSRTSTYTLHNAHPPPTWVRAVMTLKSVVSTDWST